MACWTHAPEACEMVRVRSLLFVQGRRAVVNNVSPVGQVVHVVRSVRVAILQGRACSVHRVKRTEMVHDPVHETTDLRVEILPLVKHRVGLAGHNKLLLETASDQVGQNEVDAASESNEKQRRQKKFDEAGCLGLAAAAPLCHARMSVRKAGHKTRMPPNTYALRGSNSVFWFTLDMVSYLHSAGCTQTRQHDVPVKCNPPPHATHSRSHSGGVRVKLTHNQSNPVIGTPNQPIRFASPRPQQSARDALRQNLRGVTHTCPCRDKQ